MIVYQNINQNINVKVYQNQKMSLIVNKMNMIVNSK